MSARVDQRAKSQPSHHSSQGSSADRRPEYDYNQLQMHNQAQQVPYTGLPMSSPTGDSYNYYQSINNFSYPSCFDPTTWNPNSTEAAYYGQDYMFGLDYGFSWPMSYDYASWSAQPMDPLKDNGQVMTMMGPNYSEYYQSPNFNSNSSGCLAINGNDVTVNGVADAVDTSDLELGIKNVYVNGTSDLSNDSPSDSSLPDSSATTTSNSSSKGLLNGSVSSKPMSYANALSKAAANKPSNPVAKPPKTVSQESPAVRENGSVKNQSNNNATRTTVSAPRTNRNSAVDVVSTNGNTNNSYKPTDVPVESDPTLNKLKLTNTYNPKTFDLEGKNARFFVIKSYSEDDIHRAIKYGVWCSTEHGNKRLDAAFREREGKGPVYLFYSVNGSGHFCGMAQMMSGVDYQTHVGVWTQDKWKGSMEIKWIYVKDVPNNYLRHIKLENNDNKPVTNSRDTQEIPSEKGKQVLKIIHTFRHTTSIFDDFSHYEKKEVEENGDVPKRKIATGEPKNSVQ